MLIIPYLPYICSVIYEIQYKFIEYQYNYIDIRIIE